MHHVTCASIYTAYKYICQELHWVYILILVIVMTHNNVESNFNVGRIILTLEEYRISRNISKNKIVLGAGIQRTQLQKYCQNKVARVDLGVLARICCFLNCELSDIMYYERSSQ